MNLEQFKNAMVGKKIGFGDHGSYGIGGECGELASYWFSELTGNKYQFAYGKPGINAAWSIGSDCYTAWNVATQSDFKAMGFERIANPKFSDLREGDIFFISARAGLSTGHVGIVYSTANNNVTTLEQNFGGARYTQLMAGANSWSYYGGFNYIIRPIKKEQQKPTETKGEEDMYLMKIVDGKGKEHDGKWFVSNGVQVRYVRTQRFLKNYQDDFGKLRLPVDKIYSTELFDEFGKDKIIW